jgi:hypothetical protein
MTDALDSYHGTTVANGNFPKLSEENKGKPKLDPQEEYVFELIKRDLKEGAKGFQSKEDKTAGKDAPKVTKVFLTWKELKSGNLVMQSERIDKLYWGNPDGTMKSGVLQFLEDIGMPQTKNNIPSWGGTFIITMKIRARIQQRIKNNEIVPDEYIFKDGSFRGYRTN